MTASWLASAFNATLWRRKRTESVRIQAWAYAGGPWGDPDTQWAAVGNPQEPQLPGKYGDLPQSEIPDAALFPGFR